MVRRDFRLIVGLGNPGAAYEATRHNLGFIVVRELARTLGTAFRKDVRVDGWLAHVKLGHVEGVCGELEMPPCDLLLPATYMNESGRSVAKWLRSVHGVPEDVLVVADDLELPFGTIRVRAGGGARGHNGLRSIGVHLGTNEFARVQLGIGKAASGDQADYVLSRFTAEEQEALPEFATRAVETIQRLMTAGMETVMAESNATRAASKRAADEKEKRE